MHRSGYRLKSKRPMLHCRKIQAAGDLPAVFSGQKESPMSIATYHTSSAANTKATPARERPSKRTSLFWRLVNGFIAARQRRAFEELKRHGVLLPHELEQAGWKINERSEDSLPFNR